LSRASRHVGGLPGIQCGSVRANDCTNPSPIDGKRISFFAIHQREFVKFASFADVAANGE
jgi:hypothetical protein